MSLENKTILFVDDLPDSVEIHVKRLTNKKNANVIVNRSIDQAIETIKQEEHVHFVVIDLYLPRDYTQVEQYEKDINANHTNQGELLAYYLKNHCNKAIPYLYLTSQSVFYKGTEDLLFTKSGQNIDEVIKKIEALLCSPPVDNATVSEE